MVINECSKRLGLHIYCGFDLYRDYPLIGLYYKIYLHLRVILAEISYGHTHRDKLRIDILLGKCALIFLKYIVTHQYLTGRNTNLSAKQTHIKHEKLENILFLIKFDGHTCFVDSVSPVNKACID